MNKSAKLTIVGIILAILYTSFLYFTDIPNKSVLGLNNVLSKVNKDVSVESKKDIETPPQLVEAVQGLMGLEINDSVLAAPLLKRLNDGELDVILHQYVDVYNVEAYQKTSVGNFEQYTLDVILKKGSAFIWTQFVALWDAKENKLYDFSYKPIDYLGRIAPLAPEDNFLENEVLKFTAQLFQNLRTGRTDFSQMGWRYQGDTAAEFKFELMKATLLGSNKTDISNEAAVIVEYTVKILDRPDNEIKSFLYLKSYEGVWQVEDIKIIDIKSGSAL